MADPTHVDPEFVVASDEQDQQRCYPMLKDLTRDSEHPPSGGRCARREDH